MANPTSDILRNQRNRPTFLQNLIIIRLVNAWWINTFFQPDEYFQSLEPAWQLAFGSNSGAWLTWVCTPQHPLYTIRIELGEKKKETKEFFFYNNS